MSNIVGFIAIIFSLVGIGANSKKYIECWFFWIIADICWIFRSYSGGDYASCAVWTIYLLFSVYGWWSWKNERHL